MLKKNTRWIFVLVPGCAVFLGGCVVQPPEPAPTPVVVAEVLPTMLTQDQAMVAADALFADYLAALDTFWQTGASDPTTMASTTSTRGLVRELELVQGLAGQGRVQVGASSFDHLALQQFSAFPDGSAVLDVTVCVDLADTTMVDTGTGLNPKVPSPARTPLSATLVTDLDSDTGFVVDELRSWEEEDFCV